MGSTEQPFFFCENSIAATSPWLQLGVERERTGGRMDGRDAPKGRPIPFVTLETEVSVFGLHRSRRRGGVTPPRPKPNARCSTPPARADGVPQGRVGVRCFVPSTSCTCAQACERWLPLGNCSVGQPLIVGRDLGQPSSGKRRQAVRRGACSCGGRIAMSACVRCWECAELP
jgi:hypothetical protein